MAAGLAFPMAPDQAYAAGEFVGVQQGPGASLGSHLVPGRGGAMTDQERQWADQALGGTGSAGTAA